MLTDRSNAELSNATQRRNDRSANGLRRFFQQQNWMGQSLSFWISLAIVFVLAMTPVAIPRLIASFDHDARDWLSTQAAAENKLVSEISVSESYFLIGWAESSSRTTAERSELLTQKLLARKSLEGWPWFPRVLDLSDRVSNEANVLAVTLSPKLVSSPESLRVAIYFTREVASQECGIDTAEVHLGGPAVENLAFSEQAIVIISLLVPLSMVTCFGLHYVMTKQARISLLLALVACVTAAITFSTIYYAKLIDWSVFGQNQEWLSQVDILLLILPAVVFCLTFALGSQLVGYFRWNQIVSGNLPAPWLMLRQNWKVVLLSTLLGVVFVLTLLSSEVVPLQRFSIFLAIGILVGSALLLILLPMALNLLASIGLSPAKQKQEPNYWIEDAFDRAVQYQREALLVGLIVILVASMSFTIANRSAPFISLLSTTSQVAEDQEWFAKKAGIMPTLYAIQGKELRHEASRTLSLAITISLFASACLLIARTQNNQLVFAILLPTLFAIAMTLGIAKIVKQPFGVGTALAVAVGMFLTLSQTLHFRNWMQQESDLTISNEELIKRSWLRSMPTSLTASVALMGGIIPFALSSFGPLNEFSTVTLIWLPTSLVAVGILFPAAWLFVQTEDINKATNPAEELAIKLLPPPHWFDEPKPTVSSLSVEEDQQQALEEILSILEAEEIEEDLFVEPASDYQTQATFPAEYYDWQSEQELEDAENEALRQRLRRFRRGA